MLPPEPNDIGEAIWVLGNDKWVGCKACGADDWDRFEGSHTIRQCQRCGGIEGDCYYGDYRGIVHNDWAPEEAQDRARYFDLVVLTGDGPTRYHGWYDPMTHGLVQAG